MGIYDRDYERSYGGGGAWGDGGSGGIPDFRRWSANGKLLGLLLLVFVVQNLADGTTGWFTRLFALPSDWPTQPWRIYGLLTYSLLHGDMWHILYNSLALFFFGRVVNQQRGDREHFAFFFTAALCGSIAWTLTELFYAEAGGPGLLLGASGGVVGIVVLFCLMYPNQTIYVMLILPIPASMLGIIVVGGDMYGAWQRLGGVAYTAHLGGALFAYLYFRNRWRIIDWLPEWLGGEAEGGSGLNLKKLFKRKPKLRVHREQDDSPANPGDERVDEVLRKIQSQGQDSLTREEQRILERASRRYQQRRQ